MIIFTYLLISSKHYFKYILTGMVAIVLSLSGVTTMKAQNTSISISTNNNESKIHYDNGSNSFKIEYKGDITISDDDMDIVAISDGGFFEIEKKAFGSKRRILIESDRNGILNRKYFIGRREKEYVPTGESWLANILPEVVREVGLGAEERVARFYKKGGVQAVLAEISEIESDHVIAMYYDYLLEKDLTATEVIALLDDLDDNLDSDHYLSDILRGHDDIFLISPQSTDAYIKSVTSLDSDHYTSEVLKDLIDNNNISDQQVLSLLDITKGLDSDHYMSEILRELIDERDLTSSQSTKIVELIGDLDSDHYITEVLKDLLDERHLSQEVLSVVTSSLDNISSDHYLTEIVKSASRHNMDAKTLEQLLKSINENISSDHYHVQSLESILDNDNFTLDLSLPIILEGIEDMSSDNYATELIEKVANMDDISDENLIRIIEAIEDLDSDSYKAKSLESISHQVSDDNSAVYKAYRNAARTIDSETYYGRAMRAID